MGLPDWLLPKQIKPKKSKKKNAFTDPFVGAVNHLTKPPDWIAPAFGKKAGWKGSPFSKYDKIVDRGIDPSFVGARQQSKSTGKGMRKYSKGYGKKGSYKPSYATKRYSAKKRKRKTVIQGRVRFKKARKVGPKTGKHTKRVYSDSGIIERNNAVYYGMPSFSSTDRMFEAVGEACARAVANLMGWKPRSKQDPFPPRIKALKLFFKAIDTRAGTINEYITAADQTDTQMTAGWDFGDVCNYFRDQIKGYANFGDTHIGGTGVNTLFGMYPAMLELYNQQDDVEFRVNRFYDTMIDLNCIQTVKIQNISPVPGGAPQSTDAIGVNALKGKVIHFSDNQPRVRDELVPLDVSAAAAEEFQEMNVTTGHKCLSDTSVGSYTNFARLRDPRSIFSNVSKVGYIRLAPNEVKVERIVFKCHHTLKTLVRMYGNTRWDHGTFGKHVQFAFQLDMPENVTTTDKIKLEFFRNTTYYSYARLGRDSKPLPRIEQTYEPTF